MKKAKIVEVEEFYCDICGEPANGEFWLTINYLGVDDYPCPFDLCEEHMRDYAHLIDENLKKTDAQFKKIIKQKKIDLD